MTNKEIGSLFKQLATIMEIHDENVFKTRSYANAAFQIDRHDEPLKGMALGDIGKIRGVGGAISTKVLQILETGQLPLLEKYRAETPPGVLDMLKIKGIGGRKIGVIWRELGVDSVAALRYACYENRLALLDGFGEKTQQTVLDGIAFLEQNRDAVLWSVAEKQVQEVLATFEADEAVERVEVAGEFRRLKPVVRQLDFVIDSKDAAAVERGAQKLGVDMDTAESGRLASGLKVNITRVQGETRFREAWFKATQGEAKVTKETEWPPETWDLPESQRPATKQLIATEDIRGVVHAHSQWSDGRHTLKEMAEACRDKGYEYLVISDHSRSAVYARGLSIERLQEQAREVDKLNQALAPFRIFHGIESDILTDGQLDYPDEVLATLDVVIASVHQHFKMDEAQATERLLKAIRHPATKILGHPTGRLLLGRPGYPLDFDRIIRACAEEHVVIELNANPHRLDVDESLIYDIVEAGVQVSINPDAHSIAGIDDIRFGVQAARRGGLTKAACWNAQGAAQLSAALHV